MFNKSKLAALALTPFVIGNLVSFIVSKGYITVTLIISVLFLAYWFWIGMISNKFTGSALQSILIGNSFGIICIFLLLGAGLFFKSYIPGFIGLQLQMYFMPTVRISSVILSVLTSGMNSHILFGVSFILMVVVYFSGYLTGSRKIRI